MIGLIQRVSEASVTIDQRRIAEIASGLMVLVGIERFDTVATADRLAERLTRYRVFPDHQGKMNLDILEHEGQILLVPQFTLVADTTRGRRPGFSNAAAPEDASALFDELATFIRQRHIEVHTGRFGADMKVGLINDGPVTFWLRVDPQE